MRQKQITLAQFINKEPPVFEFADNTTAHTQKGVFVRVSYPCVRTVPVGINGA